MKRLIPILAIAFVMAFGSVSATSYTNINMNSLTTTIVSPVQEEAASDSAEESTEATDIIRQFRYAAHAEKRDNLTINVPDHVVVSFHGAKDPSAHWEGNRSNGFG